MVRRTPWWGVVAVLAVGGLWVGKVRSAEGQPNMQEMMARWEAAMTPGEPHAFLAQGVGEWETTIKSWMGGPDAPPTESKGKATCKMILGGRFLQEELTAELMGQPVEMITLSGYDNFKGKYVFSHVDSMGTAMLHAEGFRAPGSNEVVYWGTMDEPMTGERDKTVKCVTRVIDADHSVFEMHDFAYPEGKTKVIEVTYTRAR